MTTIVCDRTGMVADTLASSDIKLHVNKIHRLPDGSLIAGAGNFSLVLQAIAFVASTISVHVETGEWPHNSEDSVNLLHLREEGIFVWDGPVAFEVNMPVVAIGSGAAAALGVWHHDKNASLTEMVLAASQVDPYTNAEVQWVPLCPSK